MAHVVKNPPASAGDIRDTGSIPGLGRSHGAGHGNPLQYSWLGNPWREEPGGLQPMGCQIVRHEWSNLACMHVLYNKPSDSKVIPHWSFRNGAYSCLSRGAEIRTEVTVVPEGVFFLVQAWSCDFSLKSDVFSFPTCGTCKKLESYDKCNHEKLFLGRGSSLFSSKTSSNNDNNRSEGQKVKVLVTQSCLPLSDPMDCSWPGSSVHGIL